MKKKIKTLITVLTVMMPILLLASMATISVSNVVAVSLLIAAIMLPVIIESLEAKHFKEEREQELVTLREKLKGYHCVFNDSYYDVSIWEDDLGNSQTLDYIPHI